MSRNRFQPPESLAVAVIGAKADRAASELRLNETVLNAVEAGWSFRRLADTTDISVSHLHRRAKRAETLRPVE